jgi:hypothetical protein
MECGPLALTNQMHLFYPMNQSNAYKYKSVGGSSFDSVQAKNNLTQNQNWVLNPNPIINPILNRKVEQRFILISGIIQRVFRQFKIIGCQSK